MNANLLDLQTLLGYSFRQPWLLLQALTHRSYAVEHNERLEFLGDTVLNLAITQWLFIHYPSTNEGDLSRSRARLVCQDTLHQIAITLHISNYMRLGEGELHSGGRTRPSMMADMVESVLGAIFLDSNYDTVALLIARLYKPLLNRFEPGHQQKDPKSKLQEILQANQLALPNYTITTIKGAQHQQFFEVLCRVDVWNMEAKGRGVSRKLAEQAAAAEILTLRLDTPVKQPLRTKKIKSKP
jgi:ribonuclease III